MPDLGLSALTNIGNLSSLTNLNGITGTPQTDLLTADENSFSNVLTDTLSQYQETEGADTIDTLTLLTGNTEDLSSTMIASQKAELALNLTISVRNKAINAYNTIMNMQI